ncbi:MAG: DUF305 domain-containing protein [Microcystaceae cyanobacterium]
MNKKLAIYSLVALMTGSTVTAFSIGARANARDRTQAPRPATIAQMQRGMSKSSEVDRAFIEMMVPHHQSASEMAEMALSQAKMPEVKKLAQKIIQDQGREIKQMQTWYKQWYGTEIPMMNMGNMSMSSQMEQPMMMSMQQQDMMDKEMMETLKTAPDFDQEFLRQMTRHHQMATMMAGMVIDSAKHSETRSLAQSIIKSQSAEIAQMNQLMMQARAQ